jgi:hypothetical protein
MRFPHRLLAFLLLVPSLAVASVLRFEGTPETLSGVTVYPKARFTHGGRTYSLELSGKGHLRRNWVFLTVTTSVVASYLEDPAAARRAPDMLSGVNRQRAKALTLTALLPVPASKIRLEFEKQMALNGVPADSPARSLLYRWNRDLRRGESALLVSLRRPDGTDWMVLELPGQSHPLEGRGITDDFWKVWFGRGDAHIRRLQKELLGKED